MRVSQGGAALTAVFALSGCGRNVQEDPYCVLIRQDSQLVAAEIFSPVQNRSVYKAVNFTQDAKGNYTTEDTSAITDTFKVSSDQTNCSIIPYMQVFFTTQNYAVNHAHQYSPAVIY
jgi:hypothetical protein